MKDAFETGLLVKGAKLTETLGLEFSRRGSGRLGDGLELDESFEGRGMVQADHDEYENAGKCVLEEPGSDISEVEIMTLQSLSSDIGAGHASQRRLPESGQANPPENGPPKISGDGTEDESAAYRYPRNVEIADNHDGEVDDRSGREGDERLSAGTEHGSAESSEWAFDAFLLDAEMVQLVKARNGAAGICIACQELFSWISTVRPDQEGGRMTDPFGNDVYDGSSWVKGYKPTLFHYANSTLPALTASAKTGCGTCRMLLESLKIYQNPKYYQPVSEWFVAVSYSKHARFQWRIWLQARSTELSKERANGYTLSLIPTTEFLPEKHHHPDFFESGQDPLADSLSWSCPEIPRQSTDSLPLAKLWLDHCEAKHKSCDTSPTMGQSFLPTRLLFVGDTTPRLCLTSTLPCSESVRYSTLSHCWGSLDIVRLTIGNLVLFQKEIPPSALCKTFCDAIEITKALGLDFLWLDSLCIVQDDPVDWATEAGLMCDVYSRCVVSIAASSALDGNGGCLFTRDPERRWIQPVEMIQNRTPTEYTLVNRSIHSLCIEDTPLSTRAWVLQEHMLAPRTLHFSDTQIFWECREQEACESFPRGSRDIFPRRGNKGSLFDWAKIVSEYSSRRLTYVKDRLPALAGLAQKMQGKTGHRYTAGLWLETLEEQLLWKAKPVYWIHQKPTEPEPLLDYAPSWSWASINGMVEITHIWQHTLKSVTKHAFVLGVVGLPSGKEAFGKAQRATISMECEVLIPVQPEPNPSWRAMFHYTPLNATEPFIFWTTLDYDDVGKSVKYFLPLHTRIESDKGDGADGGYALSDPKDSRIVIDGLVLEQTGKTLGEYKRIGTFHPHFKSEEQVQRLVKLMKTFIPDLKETDYEKRYIDEKTGNERCTITIV